LAKVHRDPGCEAVVIATRVFCPFIVDILISDEIQGTHPGRPPTCDWYRGRTCRSTLSAFGELNTVVGKEANHELLWAPASRCLGWRTGRWHEQTPVVPGLSRGAVEKVAGGAGVDRSIEGFRGEVVHGL
jgi:hypothetical protein